MAQDKRTFDLSKPDGGMNEHEKFIVDSITERLERGVMSAMVIKQGVDVAVSNHLAGVKGPISLSAVRTVSAADAYLKERQDRVASMA